MIDHTPTNAVSHSDPAIAERLARQCPSFVPFERSEIEQSVSARFEKMVCRFGDRLAVKSRTDELTYDALNRRANRIARAILAVRPDAGPEPVAILIKLGTQAVAAQLGVLKSGKIFVSLDPSNIGTRTTGILENAQPGLLLTERQYAAQANELAQGLFAVMVLDDGEFLTFDGNLDHKIGPDDVAYVTYTSGSTGEPKGVVHSHRNLVHDCMRRTNPLCNCPDDRWSQFALGTGLAIKNIFCALLTGGAIFPFSIKEEGTARLARWMNDERITIFNASASLYRSFLDALSGQEQFPLLRIIRLASEAVSRQDVRRFQDLFSAECLFVNMLSTNETGSLACYVIDQATVTNDDAVPIGYPVEDTNVRLLDETGADVGFNRIGEIVVTSRYLAQGYWRRPDLTAAAFRPDPDDSDVRTYHTGDLGRMRPDGCLEYVGRKDFRVKIRGYRVEVGDVEAALLALDGIKTAIVAAREDVPGQTRLVAYLVPAIQPPPSISVLRSALAAKLPDYMIPSAYVFLKALPVLPTGKVDRRALPAPGRARPHLSHDFVAPRTPVEQSLAAIWAEVLGFDEVGISDHFLDLGGTSLLAAMVISRVIRAFHVEVSLQEFLAAPTVADLAIAIAQWQAEAVTSDKVSQLLNDLDDLSMEQVQQLLAAETTARDGGAP